jgi:plasmid maintenance system antidote protein VapI
VTDHLEAEKAFLEHEDVMELLRLEIARAGSQGRWAEKMGIDRTQLNKMLHGRQVLSKRVIKALKLRVVFTRAAASLKHPAKRKRA